MSLAAVVLAAGLSRRMGAPKLVLPWGQTTVIRHVVEVLAESGLDEVLVVTGGAHAQVAAALAGAPVRLVFNPVYEHGEMLSSIQLGLQHLPAETDAALVCLGDQPQVQAQVIFAIMAAYRASGSPLVVPSYQNHRGHPWLAGRALWPEILSLTPPATLRTFLNQNNTRIHYLDVDTPSVLVDIDTPEDYTRQHP
jgi:molybdenum cofactor cytidylyltransferase